jgi:hypothetical protein
MRKPEQIGEHDWIGIETRHHSIAQQTNLEDSDFHKLYPETSARNIPLSGSNLVAARGFALSM